MQSTQRTHVPLFAEPADFKTVYQPSERNCPFSGLALAWKI